MSKKVLKLKTGEVYIDGKTHSVFMDAWQKIAKDGQTYYELRTPIFVKEVIPKEQKKIEA